MKTVLAALIQAAKQIKYVQKKGYNDFQNYSYVTEADVLNEVRPALLEHGLMIIPSVESIQHDEHGNTNITVRYDIYHESGDQLSFIAAGSGNDRNSKGVGDKGIYKALTGANKYALLRVMQLATGDDPEIVNNVDEKKSPKPQALVETKAAEPPPKVEDEIKPFSIIKEAPNAMADDICSLAEAYLEDCKTVDSLRKFYSINKETWTKLESIDAARLGKLTAKFTERMNQLQPKKKV